MSFLRLSQFLNGRASSKPDQIKRGELRKNIFDQHSSLFEVASSTTFWFQTVRYNAHNSCVRRMRKQTPGFWATFYTVCTASITDEFSNHMDIRQHTYS